MSTDTPLSPTSKHHRFFAAFYNRSMARTERTVLSKIRKELLSEIPSDVERVIEIGAGTGVNLQHYPETVTQVELVEPDQHMAKRISPRSGHHDNVHVAPAESLPFPDNSCKVLIATLVLCTVDNPAKTLAEANRVLEPGGLLLFHEHVRSPQEKTAKWQQRVEPFWSRVAAGCCLTRDTASTIADAGFSITRLEAKRIPGPPILRDWITGSAVS